MAAAVVVAAPTTTVCRQSLSCRSAGENPAEVTVLVHAGIFSPKTKDELNYEYSVRTSTTPVLRIGVGHQELCYCCTRATLYRAGPGVRGHM